jgi:drug/metabolite transporter (DMT)-like permease
MPDFSLARSPFARYGLLTLGIAGLSMAGIFYAFASAPVVVIVAYRMLMATLLVVPLAFAVRASGGAQTHARFERADLVASMGSGLLFAVDLTVWAMSLKFTSVASAALFVSMHPIFVALLAWAFFRERPTPLMLAGIALGILGIVIVGAQDLRVSGRALFGDGLALLAALAETGYLLFGRHVRQRIDAPRYASVVYATCAVAVLIAALVGGNSLLVSAHDLVWCFALALIATVLGHTLVSQSLGYMPAAVVAVSFLAQPLLASLFALAFLHQALVATTVLGGLVALAGIGIVAYANERSGATSEGKPTS